MNSLGIQFLLFSKHASPINQIIIALQWISQTMHLAAWSTHTKWKNMCILITRLFQCCTLFHIKYFYKPVISIFNNECLMFFPWLLMSVISIFEKPWYYMSRQSPLSKVTVGVGYYFSCHSLTNVFIICIKYLLCKFFKVKLYNIS